MEFNSAGDRKIAWGVNLYAYVTHVQWFMPPVKCQVCSMYSAPGDGRAEQHLPWWVSGPVKPLWSSHQPQSSAGAAL